MLRLSGRKLHEHKILEIKITMLVAVFSSLGNILTPYLLFFSINND